MVNALVGSVADLSHPRASHDAYRGQPEAEVMLGLWRTSINGCLNGFAVDSADKLGHRGAEIHGAATLYLAD